MGRLDSQEMASSTQVGEFEQVVPCTDVVCRFCLDSENTPERPLIAPCRCSGSMKYVHRQCLDEWRVQSLNPKTLVQCSICSTRFRTKHIGIEESQKPWWVNFALSLAWYLSVRVAIFCMSACITGFM